MEGFGRGMEAGRKRLRLGCQSLSLLGSVPLTYTTVDNTVGLNCNVTITHCPAPPAWAYTPNLFLHQCVRVASSGEGGVLMISAGVRPVRSCAHRLNCLSLNSLAHPIVHGGDREGTSQALLVPPKRDAKGIRSGGNQSALRHRETGVPGPDASLFSRRFARTRQTGLSSDMRPDAAPTSG